ncbi:MAG TPA: hypothetical protein VG734_26460 [Lacunisphaera sp.]|nr:hypothetical protein [Lacunisphaera sp.]
MKTLLGSFLPLVAMAGLIGSARADMLTYNFSGQVSTILHDDSANTFSSTFAVGNAVNGTFTIDTTASGTPLLPWVTAYAASFTLNIDGQLFSGSAQYRIFDNASDGDGFSIINESGTYSSPALGNLVSETFFLQYLGMPTSTLSDQSLIPDPTALIPLANPLAGPHGLRLHTRGGDAEDYGALYFTVDSVTGVPDSGATVGLLGAALLSLGVLQRRRAV